MLADSVRPPNLLLPPPIFLASSYSLLRQAAVRAPYRARIRPLADALGAAADLRRRNPLAWDDKRRLESCRRAAGAEMAAMPATVQMDVGRLSVSFLAAAD